MDMRYTLKESRQNGEKKLAMLSIEDPLLITNEVGRSSFNYALVRSAFEQALQILKGVFIRDRQFGVEWRRFYKGTMMSLIMPFTQEQLQYRNWLKSFVLEYKEPEQPPSTVVCNTLLAPSIDLAKCALQRYIMSLPRNPKPLEIVDPRDLERVSSTALTCNENENSSEMTCTSSSCSDDADPVITAPIDRISTTPSEKSEGDSSEVDRKHEDTVIHTIKETYRTQEKTATLAAIVAGTNRSKSQHLTDDLDRSNGNSASSTKDHPPSPCENKTPIPTTIKATTATSTVNGRVFHNQHYYKTERITSGSRDIANGDGKRPLGSGGNSVRRKSIGYAVAIQQQQSNTNYPTNNPSSRTGARKNYQGVYYKRNGEKNGAVRRDTTPRLPSDDGGESSERDSVKNDGYQVVRPRNRPRHK
ncbi:hypothetical protein Angca_007819 [Angiostrongylus cantonensis]|nr:hypothetical protein Angca_007819 [Angiostrongylus cantonensis]